MTNNTPNKEMEERFDKVWRLIEHNERNVTSKMCILDFISQEKQLSVDNYKKELRKQVEALKDEFLSDEEILNPINKHEIRNKTVDLVLSLIK